MRLILVAVSLGVDFGGVWFADWWLIFRAYVSCGVDFLVWVGGFGGCGWVVFRFGGCVLLGTMAILC